jgi:hypothetical protein
MRVERDKLWKAAFRRYFKEFFWFFFRKDYHRIDWSKGVTFLDKELEKVYTQSNQKNRVADVLVELYLKSGKTICLLLHIEIQGYVDKLFAYRFHQMRFRIEEYFKEYPAMLAIYTDDDPDFHPKQYQKTVLGSKTLTTFNTYKVMDNPPSTYVDPNSAVAIIMEAAYQATQTKVLKDDDRINVNMQIIRKLFAAGYDKSDVAYLLEFIENYVKFDNPNNYFIFGQKIDEMRQFETEEDILFVLDTRRQLEKAEYDRECERQEKERERQEKERERQNAERERQNAERYLAISIRLMLAQGNDIPLIANAFGLGIDQILDIQEKYKDVDLLGGKPNSTN